MKAIIKWITNDSSELRNNLWHGFVETEDGEKLHIISAGINEIVFLCERSLPKGIEWEVVNNSLRARYSEKQKKLSKSEV